VGALQDLRKYLSDINNEKNGAYNTAKFWKIIVNSMKNENLRTTPPHGALQ